jgi:hypothetical protein
LTYLERQKCYAPEKLGLEEADEEAEAAEEEKSD